VPTSPPRLEVEIYAQRAHLFLAAIAQGLPASAAMEASGTLGRCSFSHDDKCFFPENASIGPIMDRVGHLSAARRLVVSGCEGGGDTTIFLVSGAVVAIASDRALRALWTDRSRRREDSLEALPDFISLPRDEEGRPIIPQSHVTALVEAQDAWALELDTLARCHAFNYAGAAGHATDIGAFAADGAAQHPSWESDEDAKLGHRQVVGIRRSGVRRVGRQDAHPTATVRRGPQGHGAVLTPDHGRSIRQQVLFGRGAEYTTAAQLSSTLNRCDFHFLIDISDAYHLSLWAGCGGELRPVKRSVIL
jgi:hypothetical protein